MQPGVKSAPHGAHEHLEHLELASTGVHWLTGLPLVGAQILVVLLARSVLVMALFTLVRRGTGSGTAGGLAVLLYAASP